MSWATWGLFVVTEFALCATPGPAVLFILSQGLRHGGRRSLWANLGILVGDSFYFLLSATGLGALLVASHGLFLALKWCGAAYLIYLGLRMILTPGQLSPVQQTATARRDWDVLRQGFVLQVSNPKALLYYI